MARDLVLDVITRSKSDGLTDAARGLDGTAKSADRTGREFRELSEEAKGLNRTLEVSRRRYAELRAEFARTGEKGALKDLRQQRSVVLELERVLKELEKAGKAATVAIGGTHPGGLAGQIADATKRVAELRSEIGRTGDTRLFGDLGKAERDLRKMRDLAATLSPQGGGLLAGIPRIGGVPGPAVAGIAGAVVGLSPFLGATIAAAVLGSAGTGGVIGGVALAAQDTRVRNAFKDVGKEMFVGLGDAASPFVQPLIGAASTFGDAWRKELPGVQQDFLTLSKAVDPLAKGIAGFVHQLHPGLSTAFKASIPLARQFGADFADFGGDLGEFLRDMARGAGGAKLALHDLFAVTGAGLGALGDMTHALSETYRVLRAIGVLPDPAVFKFFTGGTLTAVVDHLNPQLEKSTNNLKDMLNPTEELARAQEDAAEATDKQAKALDKLNKMVDDYFDGISSRHSAQRDWEAAWDDLHDIIKENGRTLDITTEKGRAVAEALDRAAAADRTLLEQGLITEQQYQDRIRLIETEAIKLGLSKKAVHELLDEYLKVPSQIITELVLRAPGLQKAFDMVKYLAGGRPVTTSVTTAGFGPTSRPPSHQAFLDIPGLASGGTVTTAGFVDVHARERLFLPRGARVEPLSQQSSSMSAAPVIVNGGGLGEMVFEWLRDQISSRGGTLAVLGLRN